VNAARVIGINRHSAERVYHLIRRHLAWECEHRAHRCASRSKPSESYFGGHREGLQGRGAAGKVAVLLKRRSKVYTRPVPNVTRETLRAMIPQEVPKGTTIHSDQFSSYDGLMTEGYRHYRINQVKDSSPAAVCTSTASRTSWAMPRPN
jgi:transposase